MNIIDLLDGNLKHVASTSGGEYSGACPFCGGNDRFRAWPEMDRAWCRQCGWKGDSVQLVRDTKGLSYPEACQYLSIEPKQSSTNTSSSIQWQPKPPKPSPGDTWQQRCKSFLEWSQQQLKKNPSIIDWLQNKRGLTLETIRATGLGYNPKQFYRDRQEFGLDPDVNKNGKPKKVWLPVGLIIPSFNRERLVRLRIRRDEIGPNDDRYILVPGGSTMPMVFGDGSSIVIVESELDAILLNQVAGDLVSVVALGNAQIRPDAETDKMLRSADLILNALDADAAGAKEVWGFWLDNYQAKRWPCIRAKDPTEMMQAGLDVRQWVLAGLPETKPGTLDIHPMARCLHGKPCPHLSAPGGTRPICKKANTFVFDLTACPLGKWAGNLTT